MVSDANIDVLIFDAKYYGERAQALLDQIPGLQLLAFGSSPIAQDLIKMASRFVPAELVAPRVSENDILRLGYSGGTTGKPKALASVQRTGMATVTIMMAEWEWPSLHISPNHLNGQVHS